MINKDTKWMISRLKSLKITRTKHTIQTFHFVNDLTYLYIAHQTFIFGILGLRVTVLTALANPIRGNPNAACNNLTKPIIFCHAQTMLAFSVTNIWITMTNCNLYIVTISLEHKLT